LPYQPDLVGADGLPENLRNAHSGSRHAAAEIRSAADRAWRVEVNIAGVTLTDAQKMQMRRERAAELVQSALDARTKVLRPVVERHKAELERRRARLVEKGTPKLAGVEAERSLRLADHFAKLEPETRALRIIEALNNASDPSARELLACVTWNNPHLDLVSPETRQRCLATLIATADEGEYAELTQLDGAVQATEASIENLERWSGTLSSEY